MTLIDVKYPGMLTFERIGDLYVINAAWNGAEGILYICDGPPTQEDFDTVAKAMEERWSA